ncbi:MAG: serpin family protein [Candidatus Korarchaeota archaeon NZ13-K]|nr:MAG: serpin family protein [Candidatus Korarchaeota archaeon NZ13-K]
MMRLLPEVPFNYSDTGECEVLELPHEGRTSMLIFLPKGNGRPDISLEEAERAMKSMREVRLDEIIIPKFEITSEYDLNGLLMGMGSRSAFSPDRADFSGMYRREEAIGNLYVSLVRHKARIALDEEGTEAAGATGVVVGITAARERRTFVADHPFAFLIVDRETGTILFMGSVVNPASG